MDTENTQVTEPQVENTPTENTTANTTEESAPDYSDDALIASFAADYEKDNPPAEEPDTQAQDKPQAGNQSQPSAAGTSQPEEPTFEVIVNGKKERVTQQELINGYMRQSDYSRKTQELARLREETQQNNLPNKTENSSGNQKKVESSSLQDELTKLTEQKLGLAPGEFNPYDDRHLFTRQQLLLEFNNLKKEQESLRHDVATFVQQAEQDPLASEIDKNFDTLLYEAASRDPRVRPLVQQVLDAKNALKSGTLNREQANLLAAHWNFTRNYLQQQQKTTQAPQSQQGSTPTPIPKTINSSQTAPKTYSSKRLRSMSHDDDAQLDYLISQGLIKD